MSLKEPVTIMKFNDDAILYCNEHSPKECALNNVSRIYGRFSVALELDSVDHCRTLAYQKLEQKPTQTNRKNSFEIGCALRLYHLLEFLQSNDVKNSHAITRTNSFIFYCALNSEFS